MNKLTDHAKGMIEDSGNWTMTEVTKDLVDTLMEQYSLSKADTRKLLARALTSNIVRAEIASMVHYIMTGECPEE